MSKIACVVAKIMCIVANIVYVVADKAVEEAKVASSRKLFSLFLKIFKFFGIFNSKKHFFLKVGLVEICRVYRLPEGGASM